MVYSLSIICTCKKENAFDAEQDPCVCVVDHRVSHTYTLHSTDTVLLYASVAGAVQNNNKAGTL